MINVYLRYLLFYLSVSTCAMIGLFHCPARSIQKFVLMAKMSGRKFWNTFKGKVRTNKKNKTQKQISQTFELVSSRFWRKTSDEWRRRARRRQLDSRSRWFHRRRKVVKHKMKKTKKTKCEWKTFEGFADSRQMDILMKERTHCCSRKAPWQFLKMPPSKMLASTNQTVFQAFEKAYSSYLRLARLSLYVHSSKNLAK